MLWIEYCGEEADPHVGIPDELKYHGWRTDKDIHGETPLM